MNSLLNLCLLLLVPEDLTRALMKNDFRVAQEQEQKQGQEQDAHLPRTAPADVSTDLENSRSGDLTIIQDLNAKAIARQDKGQYADAEPLFLQALTSCEEYVGPDQALLLVTTMNHLARLY